MPPHTDPLRIGVAGHVNVAYTVGVPEDGDVGVGHDIANEFVRAAGDDQVDVFFQSQHLGDILARFEQLNPAGGQARILRGPLVRIKNPLLCKFFLVY